MTILEHEILSIRSPSTAGNKPHEQGVWRLEALRAAAPMHPLEHDLVSRAKSRAFSTVAAELGLPVRADARRVNGYAYHSYTLVAAHGADLEQSARAARGRIMAAAERLGERWTHEQLPEIEQHLAYWRGFHLRGATITGIIRHFDETVRRLDRVWRMFYDAGLPMAVAPGALAELHVALFGADAEREVPLLLQGIESESRALDRELRRLAGEARSIAYVREALRWCADHEVIEALLGTEEGRGFLQSLRALMRDVRLHGEPSWIEDPLPLVQRLKHYVSQPTELVDAAEAQAQARRTLEAAIADRLVALPEQLAQHYTSVLRAAQDTVRLHDERDLWIDQRVMLELGRRFAEAGIIALAGDVFYLELPEVRQSAETMPWVDMRPRIARRRAELARARITTPAAVLGRADTEQDDLTARLLDLAYGAQ